MTRWKSQAQSYHSSQELKLLRSWYLSKARIWRCIRNFWLATIVWSFIQDFKDGERQNVRKSWRVAISSSSLHVSRIAISVSHISLCFSAQYGFSGSHSSRRQKIRVTVSTSSDVRGILTIRIMWRSGSRCEDRVQAASVLDFLVRKSNLYEHLPRNRCMLCCSSKIGWYDSNYNYFLKYCLNPAPLHE